MRHADDERFIVNTTSLRNYRQIASAIPVSILAHKFTANDLAALRASAAAQIRDKIADGLPDNPMSLVSPIDEPQPGVIPSNVEIRADPDEETVEGELEARPAAAQATTQIHLYVIGALCSLDYLIIPSVSRVK